MEQNETSRPVNPRRRKRSQMQIIKEAYLPVIIAALALVLIIIFIVGSISRAVQRNKLEKEASIAASIAQEEEDARIAAELAEMLTRVDALAAGYDYEGALALLDTFQGDSEKYPEVAAKRVALQHAQEDLVAWEDPGQVLNLSFQVLVADPTRAFADSVYGSNYNRNFVTVDEFSKILMQLYENGYVLVNLEDFITTTSNADGTTSFAPKALMLPEGKKPLMLTQNQVNYYTYMTDSDGDKLPDKNADGFANRLVVDSTGSIECEYISAGGDLLTGDYDLVPILNNFIQHYPDFSYQGAKAILAVSGYDGLFGYRTNAAALDTLGQDAYNQEVAGAKKILEALRADGYQIACYTYDNIAYGDRGSAEIKADLVKWSQEVTPILGQTDLFVFARESDIANQGEAYSGEKFDALNALGFRYYIGFSSGGSWALLTNSYIRQGRIMVAGTTMAHHADWFSGIFDVSTVLDPTRGSVPM